MAITPLEHLRNLRRILRPATHKSSIDWLAALRETAAGWQAISDGKFVEWNLLTTILAEAFLPAPDSASRCVLLSAAQQRMALSELEAAELDRLIDQIRRLALLSQKSLNPEFDEEGEPSPNFVTRRWWFHSIVLRSDLIRWWFRDDDDSPTMRQELARHVFRARGLIRTDVWDALEFRPSVRPAVWERLHAAHPATANLLDDVVVEICGGWHDPAASFVCNTLLLLDGGDSDVRPSRQRRDDGTGAAWILIAVDDHAHENTKPTGMLLKFSIEVIPDGCGVLYPHPMSAAHVVTHKTFQQSLRNAWAVVLSAVWKGHRCDYRWSVSIVDDSTEADEPAAWHRHRQAMILSPLHGRSGEAAAASALKSAVDGTPLDRSRAVTGWFHGSLPIDCNPRLRPIKSVIPKALGIKSIQRSLHTEQIDHLVLCGAQTLTATALPEGLQRVDAADFDGVFKELSRDAFITRELKRRLRTQAVEFFQKECFGDPEADDPLGSYILSQITRMPDDRDPPEAHEPDPKTDQPKPIALDDSDRRYLLLGILRDEPNQAIDRVRPLCLVADSGMGKTTLLWRCLYEIANGSGPQIPVLLQSLSDYLRRDTPETFLREVSDDLEALLPDWTSDERLAWLTRKVRRGEVVFLLDALDQTSGHRRNLNGLVRKITRCPFLLTLRPDAKNSHDEAFRNGVAWDEVEVQPFTEDDARAYLAPWGDLFFNRLSSEDDKAAGSVLTIPLILHLLRNFAIDSGIDAEADPDSIDLPELRNRYSIYQHAICGSNGLIAKGLDSLRDTRREVKRLFNRRSDTVRKLSEIALWQVRQHHFDNLISEERYDALIELLKFILNVADEESIREALTQLDLVTARSMVETDGTLVWRHRSFFEFLAGCRLAELIGSDDEAGRELAIDILFDIHNCLDEDGSTRMFETVGEDGHSTQQFRDLPADWQWTLRFALAHAQGQARDRLAMELMAVGNPWVVYDAISQDQVSFSECVEALSRWLVHQNRFFNGRNGRDFSAAVIPETASTTLNSAANALSQFSVKGGALRIQSTGDSSQESGFDKFFQYETRDAGCLSAAMTLVSEPGENSGERCRSLLLGKQSKEHTEAIHRRLQIYLDESRFIRLPPPHDGVSLSDFPVTNFWFELFCPSHRRLRNALSSEGDQPALFISPYMAEVFCSWLSDLSPGFLFRIPTLSEWHAGCSWGRPDQRWWVKNPATAYDDDRIHRLERKFVWTDRRSTDDNFRTRSRADAIAAHSALELWHPSRPETTSAAGGGYGLLDIIGNVWEWASHDHEESLRVCGGAYDYTLSTIENLENYSLAKFYRGSNVGLRIARVSLHE